MTRTTTAALIAAAVLLTPISAQASPDELRAVAVTIAAEAANQGPEGLQAVANTIANRARLYKKTPYQVVNQRNQYFGYTAKNRFKLYNQVKKQADYLASHIMSLPDITGGAIYFLLPGEPIRGWHGKRTVRIGAHTFYRAK